MTTVEPPAEHHLPEGARNARSIVVVNTGDGKGKSTAAFGIVMRAVARDWPVAVVQFLKSGEWHVGEEDVARRLGVEWWALGEGFTWDSENLTQDQAVAREAWARAKALIQAGEHRLVVLDEITYPMMGGWIDTDDVVATIRDRPRTGQRGRDRTRRAGRAHRRGRHGHRDAQDQARLRRRHRRQEGHRLLTRAAGRTEHT